MRSNAYDAVIFDLDDTLTCTWRTKWDQLKTIGDEVYDITLTDEEIAAHFDKPLEVKLRTLYQDDQTPFKDLVGLLDRYNDQFPRTLLPDSLPTLSRLAQAGILTGIVTGGHTPFVERDLERLEFPTLPLGYYCYNTPQLRKPQPQVFDEIFHAARVQGLEDKTRMMYVGDSLDDYYAATAADLDFIGVATGRVAPEVFQDAGAHRVLARLGDLVLHVASG